MLKRALVLGYGAAVYALFLGVFLYLIAFVMGDVVPTTVDGGAGSFGLLGNLALVALFGIQHTIMARSSFKDRLSRLIPQAAERSTFVLLSSLALIALFIFWSPLGGVIWNVQTPWIRALLYSVALAGWAIALLSTFLINHFDLFGLRQVYFYFLGKEYQPVEFKMALFYRYIRHPLMLGFLIAFWSTPTMSMGHFVFSLSMTAYILIGIQFEERELSRLHGANYESYKKTTGMIFPYKRSL